MLCLIPELMTLEPQGDPTQPIQQALPAVFRFLDLSGVFFNGILGGRLAREKRFDFVGFVVLGMLSGMGGGIVRDVMLNAGPPIALTDRYYLIMALLGALIAWLWRFDGKWSRRTLVTFDALVLGCWAATGTSKALGLGFAVIPSILMGVTTAIGGGMIRDISAGNVPAVFGGNSLYATPALCAACLDAGLFQAGYPLWGMLASTVLGSTFTILASWRRWVLPEARSWTVSMTHRQWRLHQRKKRLERDSRRLWEMPDTGAEDEENASTCG